MKLTGNTILVIGGATGIGFSLARLLAQLGNQVIICGRSETALFGRHKRKCLDSSLAFATFADRESRRPMVEWLKADHPTLDVVIR
ncbi:short-subunit dehydrogenase involved in D-alanine esterification of teichoic acids [Sinorhizobium fredii]|uniref:SDR family NAD(P)-dependent oxidoreductase n=1 Tax=Rhizobium fredii TaxID=380 RepID=UPI00030C75A3